MTSDPSYSYTWNAESELTSFGGSYNYTYDGDGKRVENSYNGYYYWFSPDGLPLSETNSGGTVQNEYIYFNGARTARRDSSGNVYYYFSNQTGSTNLMTTSSGTVCFDADRTPFGYEMDYTTTCSQNYNYAGMELDGGTGNYHTWFRQYEPNLGRWMSPDLLGGDVTNPQSLNRYAYALNNPASLVDPLGLDAGDACEAAAAQFDWFDCPNGSGGAGLGSGGAGGGGGIGIDPSLCFDEPLPDPSCGMPPGIGGGGGVWGGGGGGSISPGLGGPFPGGPGMPGIPGNAGFPQIGGIPQAIVCAVFPLACSNNGTESGGAIPIFFGFPIATISVTVHPAAPSTSAPSQSRVNIAAKAAATGFLIGEGVAAVGGCVIGGIVAAGGTAVTETYPLGGATIPMGCVGGAMITAVEAAPWNFAQSIVTFGVVYLGH